MDHQWYKKWLRAAFILSSFYFLIFPLVSCESISCPLNNTVSSVYGFYATARGDDGVFVEGSAVTVGDTLTVTALGPDTVLINKLVGQSGMSLPVSYYADIDTLEFAFVDAQGATAADTLWLHKKNLHHFDDPSCPVHLWHTILDVRSTHHLIDTVLISEPEINYDGLENLQIYFFTATDDEDETEE